MSNPNVIEATVSHTFSASPEAVFDAWLDPQLIGTWMFGPKVREEEVVSIDIDPKVGGAFSFLVRRQALVVDHIGTYLTVDRPTRLEFNWGVKGMADSSRVIVTIEPHDRGCRLMLTHELHPSWIDYLQRSIDGWTHMLEVLDATLQKR